MKRLYQKPDEEGDAGEGSRSSSSPAFPPLGLKPRYDADMVYTNTNCNVAPALENAVEKIAEAVRRFGLIAQACKLGGGHYIVIRSEGDDIARAFELSETTVAGVSAQGWDYPTWRTTVRAEDRLKIAVDYFLKHRGGLLASDDGNRVLTGRQREVLAQRAAGRPETPRWHLLPEEIHVLEIADELGWTPPDGE